MIKLIYCITKTAGPTTNLHLLEGQLQAESLDSRVTLYFLNFALERRCGSGCDFWSIETFLGVQRL
jgi:hypothetical protein